MPTELSSRLVTPAGETIKQLRLQYGWDVAEMARRADCTNTTVKSIEASKKCYLATINAFRIAFKLPDNSRLLSGSPPPPLVTSGRRIQIKIRLTFPFTDFDFTDPLVRFINWLIRMIDPHGDFEVISLAPGSVVITLEMDEPDSRKLVSAFGVGELKYGEWDISSVSTDVEGIGWFTEYTAPPAMTPEPPQPLQRLEPQKSLLMRFADWLLGDAPVSTDPPPYREQGASVFDGAKLKK